MAHGSAGKYHVAQGERQYGPLSLSDLSACRLTDDMMVWREGMPEWLPINEIPELRSYVHRATARNMLAPPNVLSAPRMKLPAPHPQVAPFAPPPPLIRTDRPGVAPVASGRTRFLAITSIVLASLGLVYSPLALLASLFIPTPEAFRDVIDTSVVGIVRAVVAAMMLLVSIGMLVAGIGLLKGRKWAAALSSVSSLICILSSLAAIVLEGVLVWTPLLRASRLEDSNEMLGWAVGGIAINSIATVVGLAWHLTNILLLNSRPVRSSLR